MKRKNKVVLTSMATIALCSSLLVGGTYALFTSESKVNVAVTSGTVSMVASVKDGSVKTYSGAWDSASGSYVDVEQTAGAFANGGSATVFQDSNTVQIDRITPMDKVEFEIEIVNNSNVTVQYQTKVELIEGVDLFSALEISIDGKTYDGMTAYSNWETLVYDGNDEREVVDTIKVSIALPNDENNNDVQGKSVKLAYTVNAVQGNAHTEAPEADENTLYIYNANDMKLFANSVNKGNTFVGKTVKLMSNVDLENEEWTPIGNSSNKFQGTFDGNGKTVSNLYVEGEKGLGLFGYVYSGAYIHDLTIDGAYVSGYDYLGAVVGTGYFSQNGVQNCVVKNAEIIATPYLTDDGIYDGGAKAGAVAGYVSNGDICGNSAIDCSVSAYRDLGGIVGMMSGENRAVVAENNSVKNVTLTYLAAAGAYDGGKVNQNMDDVVGRKGAKLTVANNTAENVIYGLADGLYQMADGSYRITNENGLATANANYFALGGTFNLVNSVDMTDKDWTPMNVGKDFVFNGNDNVVSNLSITKAGRSDGMDAVGFIADGKGNITINNLTFDNASIIGTGVSNCNAAVVLANTHRHGESTTILTGVTVQNSKVENCDRSAGLIGYGDNKATISIIGCSVNDTTIDSIGTAGALMAYQCKTATVNDFEVKNTSVSSSEGNGKAGIAIGTIAGEIAVSVSDFEIAIEGSKAMNAGEETNNFAGRYASGTLTVNGAYYVVKSTQLASILSSSETEINILLGNGSYMNQFGVSNKTVYVKGGKGAVVGITNDFNGVSGDQNHEHIGMDGSTFTFDGVSVRFEDGGYYTSYIRSEKLTFKDCTITGQYYIYGDTDFIGCTFDNLDAPSTAMRYTYIYTGDVLVDSCVFTTQGHGLIMYSDNGGGGNCTLTVRNTKFYAENGRTAWAVSNQNVAAIEIDGSCGANYTLNLEGNNEVSGEFSGLWRIKAVKDGVTTMVNGTEYTSATGDVFLDGEAYTKDSDRKVTVKA